MLPGHDSSDIVCSVMDGGEAGHFFQEQVVQLVEVVSINTNLEIHSKSNVHLSFLIVLNVSISF